MKKKSMLMWATAGLIAALFAGYSMLGLVGEPSRFPASAPSEYEKKSACEKQQILWAHIKCTNYVATADRPKECQEPPAEMPDYRPFGIFELLAMGRQEVANKGNNFSDFAPEDWIKFLHRRGAIAMVKIVPKGGNYTGVFQGAECGLLRLSLTYRPEQQGPVAPGLALKVLRDGIPSGNVSALVSLAGQGSDFNFFSNPLTNIVPIDPSFGPKQVHKIFRKASDYPEELLLEDLANLDPKGQLVPNPVSPRQIFFVPAALKFPSDHHDVRLDFLSIPEGTSLYQIRAVAAKENAFDYAKYSEDDKAKFLKESELIGEIITTSPFIASGFGDDGIFFRHQLRPKKNY